MDEVNDFSAYSGWTIPMIEAKIFEIENKLQILEDIYTYGKPKMLENLRVLRQIKEEKSDKLWTE